MLYRQVWKTTTYPYTVFELFLLRAYITSYSITSQVFSVHIYLCIYLLVCLLSVCLCREKLYSGLGILLVRICTIAVRSYFVTNGLAYCLNSGVVIRTSLLDINLLSRLFRNSTLKIILYALRHNQLYIAWWCGNI